MQNIFPQICSDQETNSYILYLGWLEGEYILGHFWINYFFNTNDKKNEIV